MAIISFNRPKIVLEPDWFVRDSTTPTSANGDVIRRGGYVLQSIRRELTREEKRQQTGGDPSSSSYQNPSSPDAESPLSDMDENPGIEQASGVLLIKGIQQTPGEKATLQVELIGTLTVWLKETTNTAAAYTKANSVSSLTSLAQTFSFARLDSISLINRDGGSNSGSAGSGLNVNSNNNPNPMMNSSSHGSLGGGGGSPGSGGARDGLDATSNVTATVGGAAFRIRKKSNQRNDAVSVQLIRESTMMRVRMIDIRDQESAVSFCMPLEESKMPISFTANESQMSYVLRATLSVDGNLVTMQETPLVVSYAPPAPTDSPSSLMMMSTSSHTPSPLSVASARRNSADNQPSPLTAGTLTQNSLPRTLSSHHGSVSSETSSPLRGSAMSLQDPPISPILESPLDSVNTSGSSLATGDNSGTIAGGASTTSISPSASATELTKMYRGTMGSVPLRRDSSGRLSTSSRRGTNPSLDRDRLPRAASSQKLYSSCWHKGVSSPLEWFTYRVTCPELVSYDSTSFQVIVELQIKDKHKVSFVESSSAQLIEHRLYTVSGGTPVSSSSKSSPSTERKHPIHVKWHIHKPVTYPVNKGVPYSVLKAQESKESSALNPMLKKVTIPTLAVGEMIIMTLNIPIKQGALIPDYDLPNLHIYHDLTVDITGQDHKGNARKETIKFPVRVGNTIPSIALFNPSAFK